MKDTKACEGCEDNFYNGKNSIGVTQCWHVPTAKIIKRYAIGTWTTPTTPGAFTEVKVPNCYHRKGEHYYETLPNFAVDVNRLKQRASIADHKK